MAASALYFLYHVFILCNTLQNMVLDIDPDDRNNSSIGSGTLSELLFHSTFFCGLDLAAVGGINCKKWRPTSGKLYDGADGCDRLIMLLIICNLKCINRIFPGLTLLNNTKSFKIASSIKWNATFVVHFNELRIEV